RWVPCNVVAACAGFQGDGRTLPLRERSLHLPPAFPRVELERCVKVYRVVSRTLGSASSSSLLAECFVELLHRRRLRRGERYPDSSSFSLVGLAFGMPPRRVARDGVMICRAPLVSLRWCPDVERLRTALSAVDMEAVVPSLAPEATFREMTW